MTMDLYSVILEPIKTKKSTSLELRENTYVVKVAPDATKIDIKNAFKKIYGVVPERVNIVKIREKYKYGRKGIQLKRREFKKAYVKLAKGDKIDFSVIK